MSEEQVELSAPFLKGKFPIKRMAEIISVLAVGALLWVGLNLNEHRSEAKDNSADLKKQLQENNAATLGVIKELIELQKSTLSEQRRQTCLQEFEPKDRADKRAFCKEIGKQR